ncbi:hypothetical protein GCM10025859_00440 [Alicyclobacillus fastidiosus]|nr:hypothetical protein GCM10025859_00440 [Alicyclobacillus fastidiosus]
MTKALNAVEGVEKVDVSLEKNHATVTYDEANVTEEKLKEVIEDAGYDVV